VSPAFANRADYAVGHPLRRRSHSGKRVFTPSNMTVER
jgi:hypothetical protein